MLREIQRRVLGWLRGGKTQDMGAFHVRSGVRLWQDVVGLANLLMQVSNRPELRAHDGEIVVDVFETLFGGFSPAQQLPPAQLDHPSALLGLDEELDQCIRQGGGCSMETCRAMLSRLRDQLQGD